MKRFGHKFKAKAVTEDGHRFPSTLEWKYFKHLQSLQKSGEVVFFLRQPVFHLLGGVKYAADYQVFYSDGSVSFVDCKGLEMDTFKIKRKIVEDLYPITIEIVRKGDF
jgi:hypothetical protein